MSKLLAPICDYPTREHLKRRFALAYAELYRIVEHADTDEFEWSPDEGIPSIRNHLEAIEESAGRLVGALTGRARRRMRRASIDEILDDLKHCRQQTEELLARESDEDSNSVDESVHAHIDELIHNRAQMALLLQLIDPSRPF